MSRVTVITVVVETDGMDADEVDMGVERVLDEAKDSFGQLITWYRGDGD